MKKVISLFCVLVTIISVFCACGKKSDNSNSKGGKGDVSVLSYEISKDEALSPDYYNIKYKVQNTTKENINFESLLVIEYDKNDDIIDKYATRNKNYVPVTLKPEQSVYIEQTYAEADNIAKIEIYGYIVSDENGTETETEYTESYIVDLLSNEKETETAADNNKTISGKSGVSIVSHSLYNNTSAGVYQITYEIENNTSEEISIYALASTQYDDNEVVLNNDDCYNNSGYLNVYNDSVSLKPNEKSNFYVCVDNKNSVNIVDIRRYKNDNKEYIDLAEPYAIELYGGERVYKESDDIKSTTQAKTSIVEETFTKATNIKKSDLTGSAGNWKYDGIPLLSKDCERIDNMLSDDNAISQGVIYRKIAFVLEGSDFKEKRFLYNYEDIGKYLLGFVPKDKDEWVKYGKNASEFIVTDNQMTAIMKKFQSMKSVKGNYDFKYKKFGKFNIDISDLTKCVEEMQISEKMLGYILAMLDEYGTTITFKDNSCHIEYTSPM